MSAASSPVPQVPSSASGENPITAEAEVVYDPSATAAAFSDEAAHVEAATVSSESKDSPDHVEAGLDIVIDRFGRNENSADHISKRNSSSDRTATKFPGLVGVGSSAPQTGGKSKPSGEGLYSKVPKGTFNSRRGKAPIDADTGLFPFNYVAGRRSDLSFTVHRDDRMSPNEARNKLLNVFTVFGIEGEPHEFLYSFTHAMLVAHALNGGSMIGPGRANFFVDGTQFSYGDIVKMLGSDMRRFFRAYADETAKALALVLNSYDPCDAASSTVCGQIRMIAVSKKLIQFPYLIHDSADACVRLNTTEAAAVLQSKNFVLEKRPNAIDSVTKGLDGNSS